VLVMPIAVNMIVLCYVNDPVKLMHVCVVLYI
jgi:hypothetical protein